MGTDRTLAFAASLLLAGCAVPRDEPRDERLGEGEAAIQGGFTDPRDNGVVGVALLDEGDYVRRTCSGTLVAPNLVLTAQHCVADTAKFVDCSTSVFGSVAAAGRIRVTTSASMWSDDAYWVSASQVLLPPGAPTVCGRDVALVVLSASVDRGRAAPIAPRLDASPRSDEDYVAIGYGTTGGDTDDAGERRRRNALRVVCVGDGCSSRQIDADEWRGDQGICSGDSGGPAIDMGGFVIGVTSRGPAGCASPVYGGLVDHAGWLRGMAKQAAHDGDYVSPAWASSSPDEPRDEAHATPPAPAGCTLCTLAGGGDGGGAGGLVAAAVLALVRGARGSRLPRRARFRRVSMLI